MDRTDGGVQFTNQPVGVLFAEALSLPKEQRNVYLEEVCGNDAELRRQIEAMIEGAESVEQESAAESVQFGTIGGYDLESEIARGGMGVVYRARQIRLDRLVAIKLIRETMLASTEERARFRMEAEAAAGIEHPNLVPIYEVGEEGRLLFYSMKLIEGGTLSTSPEVWNRDRRQAMRAMAKVGRALQAVHESGVLHRDLKPGNVLLDAAGEPFLTDFGLARKLEGETMLTLSGQVLGTPNYMSPEQAQGAKLTTASDVYGLGAILYQVLTGSPPFGGESAVETLRLVVEEPPRHPDLGDRDLETIVMKCLEKSPTDRYRSAAAVADDLERWANSETISARPATKTERLRKWVRRNPTLAGFWTTAALLVLTLAIGGPLWALNQARLNAEVNARSNELQGKLYAAEMIQGSESHSQVGVDPGEIARFVENQMTEERAEFRGWEWRFLRNESQLAKVEIGQIMSSDRGWRYAVEWSPCGEWIAADDREGELLALYDPETLEIVRKFEAPPGPKPVLMKARFSPNGERIFEFRRGSEIVTIHSLHEGLDSWQLDTGASITDAEWSPDGQQLMVFGGRKLKFYDANSGDLISEEYRIGSYMDHVRWEPESGEKIAAIDGRGSIFVFKPGQYATTPRINDARPSEPDAHRSLDWSPDGKWLAFASGRGRTIDIWSAEKRSFSQRFDLGLYQPVVRFSLDSRFLAIGGTKSVLLYDLYGRQLQTLRGHTDYLEGITWAPDGSKIASASRDGSVRIWDVQIATQRLRLDTFDIQQYSHLLAATSTGSRFIWANKGVAQIRDAAKPDEVLQEFMLGDRRISILSSSPDDSLLAAGYWGGYASKAAVELYSTVDGQLLRQRSLDHDSTGRYLKFRWSPDSKYLAVRRDDHQQLLWIFNRSLEAIQIPKFDLNSMAFDWNAESELYASHRSRIVRMTLEPYRELAEYGGVRDMTCHDLRCQPGGRWVAVALDENIELLDLQTLQLEGELVGHTDPVIEVLWSPDGSRLASIAVSGSIRIWDPERQSQVSVLKMPGNRCRAIEWTADGRFLIAMDESGLIHTFDGGGDDHLPKWD